MDKTESATFKHSPCTEMGRSKVGVRGEHKQERIIRDEKNRQKVGEIHRKKRVGKTGTHHAR